jgi:hypothetical protein
LHSFPSISYGWRYQVAFFEEKGYGLIVLDLGYGCTTKPANAEAYKLSLMANYIVDVFDAKKVQM